jgi:hypothetical protein
MTPDQVSERELIAGSQARKEVRLAAAHVTHAASLWRTSERS